jgi:hypothetical protein
MFHPQEMRQDISMKHKKCMGVVIDMPMMEAMIHSKMGVSSSINGVRKSGEKQINSRGSS